MQSNPNPNDPNYMPPLEQVPPHQPAQYQNQPGVPPYQNQPGAPYATPPNPYRAPQYAAPPASYVQRATQQQKKQARKYGVAKVMDYLQWVLLALELLFLLRFVLKLIGADPNNQFAATLYAFTGFFLAPFEGIVPSTTLGANGNAVIEWSTLVGMAVYAVLFYLVRYLLRITVSRPREPIA
jgi:YggT family protein